MFTLKEAIANGGITVSYMGDKVTHARGYQVSTMDVMVMPVYKFRKKMLYDILDIMQRDECLGLWIDNKKIYVDISKHFTTKREAIRVGKANKQLAIFDWKTQTSIFC